VFLRVCALEVDKGPGPVHDCAVLLHSLSVCSLIYFFIFLLQAQTLIHFHFFFFFCNCDFFLLRKACIACILLC
jgi:hypothetical protein